MGFDRKMAERALVEVLPGRRNRGMGFRLLDDFIVTACHCLRRHQRKVVLPNPDLLGCDPTALDVRVFGHRSTVPLLVRFSEPCSDLALLSTSTAGGGDLPGSLLETADELLSTLEPTVPVLEPSPNARAFLFTHEGRWLEGRTRHSFVEFGRRVRILGGTSGAPVFDENGHVLGVVSFAASTRPDMKMCVLADHLPGWVIRSAREQAARQRSHVKRVVTKAGPGEITRRARAHQRRQRPASTHE